MRESITIATPRRTSCTRSCVVSAMSATPSTTRIPRGDLPRLLSGEHHRGHQRLSGLRRSHDFGRPEVEVSFYRHSAAFADLAHAS